MLNLPGFWGRTCSRLLVKLRTAEYERAKLEKELALLRKAYRHRTIFAVCEKCNAHIGSGEFHKKGCPGYLVEQRAFSFKPRKENSHDRF